MKAKKIMIVEDNPTNMRLASDAFALYNFDICRAKDAQEALQKMPEFLPSVILMDIQLPDVDGLTLTQLIKKNPDYADIYIIAITAYAMKEDKEKMLAAGCDNYISKPADLFAVVKLVEAYLEQKNEKYLSDSKL